MQPLVKHLISSEKKDDVLSFLKFLNEFSVEHAEMAKLCNKHQPVVKDMNCIDFTRNKELIRRMASNLLEAIMLEVMNKAT